MRRDENDEEWKEVKREVLGRDNGEDRFLKILSSVQAKAFFNFNKGLLTQKLDPAHILPVSKYPRLCYNPDNIVLINRIAHTRLDASKSPITGDPIDLKTLKLWWKAILGEKQYKRLIQCEEARLYFNM